MNKNTKTIALILVSVFLLIMVYNILSGTNNPNIAASSSQEEETPFYVSLLLAWFPFMISIIFYVLYYQCLKQIIRIGERIAVALETKSDNTHSHNTK